MARRELPGCTLRMYGGRAAKSGKEKYGGWTLCSEGVRKGAVVYSFGIGSDVSFDYAVLRRGAKVRGSKGKHLCFLTVARYNLCASSSLTRRKDGIGMN